MKHFFCLKLNTSLNFSKAPLVAGIIFSWTLTAGAAGTVVTETVGQVADHVVTSREVQVSVLMESVLSQGKALAEVKLGSPEFRSAVTTTLLENVVAMEAQNFNVAAQSEVDVKALMSQVEKAVSGRSFWTDLEISQAEFKQLATRKLVAKSFLKFKTSSMSGVISDQEAQDYYEKNRLKFGASSFESFKDNIKSYLGQQQLEERIRAWFEVIKRKYKVRTYGVE